MTNKICPLMSGRIFNDDGGPEMVYCTPQHCAWAIYRELGENVETGEKYEEWLPCTYRRRFLRSTP